MKTETQIAKENVDEYNENEFFSGGDYILERCEEHKASCERFLEFFNMYSFDVYSEKYASREISFKVKDLKQAIKTYDDAGIKCKEEKTK